MGGPPTHRLCLPLDEDFALSAVVQFRLVESPPPGVAKGSSIGWSGAGASGARQVRGRLSSLRGEEPVSVSLVRAAGSDWSELRALKRLTAAAASKHTARLLHAGVLPLHPGSGSAAEAPALLPPHLQLLPPLQLGAVVWEHSSEGTLDAFLARHKDSLRPIDAQIMSLQLIEGLGFIHGRGRAHRNLRPSSVLVSRAAPYEAVAFGAGGWQLKFTDFCTAAPSTPLASFAAATTASTAAAVASQAHYDCWAAPEGSDGSLTEQCRADCFSLGCLLLFVASRGAQASPYEDEAQLRTCMADAQLRVVCLERCTAALQSNVLAPGGGSDAGAGGGAGGGAGEDGAGTSGAANIQALLVFDLFERLLRAPATRQTLAFVRGHPYLWGPETQLSILRQVTACLSLPVQAVPPEALAFADELERFFPQYVFAASAGGWAAALSAELRACVRPALLAQTHSGAALLMAVQGLLDSPELIAAALPRALLLGAHEGAGAGAGGINGSGGVEKLQLACLKAVNADFPRLFWVLFELGTRHSLILFSQAEGRTEFAPRPKLPFA